MPGGDGAHRDEGGGRRSFPAQADGPHDHAEADAAREVPPPGEPAHALLL